VSERAQQAAIVKLLRSIQGQVYVIGTTRRKGDYQGTNQTAGLADLLCFLPPVPRVVVTSSARVLLFVEVKAQGGRLRIEQREFQHLCNAANVWHLVGDLDVVLQWLTAQGYLR
jgi:hypothetical protein